MQNLRQTVVRDLSLFSAMAWERGYREALERTFGWSYPVILWYDGDAVHFFHPAEDFAHFKDVITKELIADPARFQELDAIFRDQIVQLKEFQMDLSPAVVLTLHRLIGEIMSFYIFVVSDAFVAAQPAAWNARLLSEGVLYEADAAVEAFARERHDPSLAHVLTAAEIASGEVTVDAAIRRSGYILYRGDIRTDVNFATFCAEHGFAVPRTEIGVGEVTELKGVSSFLGVVRGTVRIVRSKEDLAKVGDGDILVAAMTNVTYGPAMQRAGAAVTDEGGVTCHAAILARELQKPCLTGTKAATQVLHDGDLVEVDANAGIVRILEKKS